MKHFNVQCATHLDGLTVVELNGVMKTRYEHFVGQNPMFAKHLRTWGEAGTVKIKTSTSPKLNDKGTHCMFVGYTYNHPGDCYRMYDPKTGRTRETRDVIWLKRMFYQRPPNQRELTTESITYDVTQEQNQDQDQDQGQDQDQTNNQANTTQKDVTMDDATSIEDGEGQSNNDDQTEQSNHDEQESAQDDAEESHQQPNETTTTSSGRAVQRPAWMDEYEMGMTAAEIKYYEAMKELGCCQHTRIESLELRRGHGAPRQGQMGRITYRSGVGKLLFLMKWSWPDVLNSVHDLSRFMSCARPSHVVAMERVMQFCLCSKEKGLKLQPSSIWNGNKNYKFNIRGRSDSDYAKRVEDRKSVTGYSTYLNDAPIFNKSKTQNSVTLSVSEAELIAAVECAQTMLFVRQILNSVGLSVENPWYWKLTVRVQSISTTIGQWVAEHVTFR